MNVFKSVGLVLQSITNVVVKLCGLAEEVTDTGGQSIINLAKVAENATGTMLDESNIERQTTRKRLEAEAEALDIQL